MPQKLVSTKTESMLLIKPFQWQDWQGLWRLRAYQLAESGITVNELPGAPDVSSPYEKDYHRIDQVYLTARGNFWIAWMDDMPMGHIGAEDTGEYIELRRMYVRKEYRRRGIGTLLIRAFVQHCVEHSVGIVKLWTAEQGPGRFLYEKHGFRKTGGIDEKLDGAIHDRSEIRMCLMVAAP